jgi:hypothetical protein
VVRRQQHFKVVGNLCRNSSLLELCKTKTLCHVVELSIIDVD